MICPQCQDVMDLRESEPDVGLVGGYLCLNEECGYFIPNYELPEHDERL